MKERKKNFFFILYRYFFTAARELYFHLFYFYAHSIASCRGEKEQSESVLSLKRVGMIFRILCVLNVLHIILCVAMCMHLSFPLDASLIMSKKCRNEIININIEEVDHSECCWGNKSFF